MIPSLLIPQLSAAADTAVNHALRHGAVAFGQSPPTGEVGFVAAVVLGAVPDMAAAWRPILNVHGYSVRMTGVFCHQTPQASFSDASGAARQCELADLLIVVDDYTQNVSGRRWATLIQAKMAKTGGGQTLTGTGDLTQLDLLSRWPPFTLPTSFAAGARQFANCPYPGALTDCGRYGLIERQPSPSWRQSAPAQSMAPGGMELGTFIAHMLEQGQTGFGREATGTSDDWSRTVDELLSVTAAQTFKHITGIKGAHPRGNSAISWIVASTDHTDLFFEISGSTTPPPSDTGPEDRIEAFGEGISFIHIGVSSKETGDGDIKFRDNRG